MTTPEQTWRVTQPLYQPDGISTDADTSRTPALALDKAQPSSLPADAYGYTAEDKSHHKANLYLQHQQQAGQQQQGGAAEGAGVSALADDPIAGEVGLTAVGATAVSGEGLQHRAHGAMV